MEMEEEIVIDHSEIAKYLKFKHRIKFLKLCALALILFILFVRLVLLPLINVFIN